MRNQLTLLTLCLFAAAAGAMPNPSPEPRSPEPPREKWAPAELTGADEKIVPIELDKLSDMSEVYQRLRTGDQARAEEAFNEVAAEAKRISQTYNGTYAEVQAAFCLTHLYELRRQHDHALALYIQCANRFAGTTYGAIALTAEAEYRLRWNLDVAAAFDAASKVPRPAEPTGDKWWPVIDRFPAARRAYYGAQLALCRCEIRLGHPEAAASRLQSLPATATDPAGSLSQEMRFLREDMAAKPAASR